MEGLYAVSIEKEIVKVMNEALGYIEALGDLGFHKTEFYIENKNILEKLGREYAAGHDKTFMGEVNWGQP